MKAALLKSPRHFEIADVPSPALKRGQILVAVKSVGICASDVHYYSDGRIGDQLCRYPQALGHECAGEVIESYGSGRFSCGARVAVEPGQPCNVCEHCVSGYFNRCPHVQFLGMPGMPGAFQEYLAVNEEQLVDLPDTMSFDDGALLEPMGVAYHAVALSTVQKNETVAIFGAGAIGLLTLALAKLKQCGTVFIFDTVIHRLDFAKKIYHADHAVTPENCNPIDYIRKHTGNRGVDISIEAAGSAQTFEWAFEAARIGGRVTIIGIPVNDRISFNAHSLRRRELLVQNVRRSNMALTPCIDLVASGAVSLNGLATHHFGLEQIGEAFDVASGYKDGVIRAMVTL